MRLSDRSSEVLAVAIEANACGAEVIQHLLPLTSQWSSFLMAIVRVPPASEPASGSLSPKATSSPLAARGRNFAFCFSVPKFMIGPEPSEL